MATQDIRWIQRSRHFEKALGQLSKFIAKGDLNELEEQGLIQAFEYTFELAWNVLKDYLADQGEMEIYGSRDAIRLAFKRNLIEDGESWMDMIRSRSLTSHTYNEDVARQIATAIRVAYFPQFRSLQFKLSTLKETQE